MTVGTSWGRTLGRSERGGRPAAGGGGFSMGGTPACCPGQRQAGGKGIRDEAASWGRAGGGFEASGIGLEKEGQPSSPRRGGQKGKGMRTGEAVAAGNGRGLSCPPFLVTPFLTFLTFMGETCELSRCSLCRLTRGLCGVRSRLCHWGPLFTWEGGWWVSVLLGSTAGHSAGSPGTAG